MHYKINLFSCTITVIHIILLLVHKVSINGHYLEHGSCIIAATPNSIIGKINSILWTSLASHAHNHHIRKLNFVIIMLLKWQTNISEYLQAPLLPGKYLKNRPS